MTLGLRISVVAMSAVLSAAVWARTSDGLAQSVKPAAPAPKAISPAAPPTWLYNKPLAAPTLPPPVLESRPGGCPEGPPCPPQTVAPDVPAVRPGGCPEGDPCPNKQ
jgi:hypothetical protein